MGKRSAELSSSRQPRAVCPDIDFFEGFRPFLMLISGSRVKKIEGKVCEEVLRKTFLSETKVRPDPTRETFFRVKLLSSLFCYVDNCAHKQGWSPVSTV